MSEFEVGVLDTIAIRYTLFGFTEQYLQIIHILHNNPDNFYIAVMHTNLVLIDTYHDFC